ncbi:FMN-binding negative transcriptional regulator [Leucobacter sp. M11]|uniref:FMN-binding negative transcriptional regulator n=1 Tax=Leucobacter sp. M11 TaxID=2993565 RepID=UPI002D7F7498|nr:FMN-binding negative transcriptional regulator [Leucobacter sp. M11]MEB4615487.1 FMN-binding negative transcriptional regulator [Leucobacter sp. M11]
MWINPRYAPDAPEATAKALIERRPLATLIAPDPLRIAHMPVLWRRDGEGDALIGHLPLADPISRAIPEGVPLTAVFPGPAAYVTPTWYRGAGLPTYNYAPVHVTGRTRRLDEGELRAHLIDLIAAHEREQTPAGCPAWHLDAAANARLEELLPQIVGFAIAIDRLEVKTKIGQNRTPEENETVAEQLASGSGDRPEISAMMRRLAAESGEG